MNSNKVLKVLGKSIEITGMLVIGFGIMPAVVVVAVARKVLHI